MSESGIAASTWKARGWTMESLYESAGRTYELPELSSRFEDRVYSILCEICLGLEVECDKKLPGMHGFKGGDLRADFFIEELQLIVEADGKQHLDGRDDPDKLDYIRANDRLKDLYAAANGNTLIRIPQTVDRRSIKVQLLRGIRGSRPRFRPLSPSNALNTEAGFVRRMPKRRETSARPKQKRGEKGPPLEDVYCRGCHERPSFKNRSTFLCAQCWDRWKDLWLSPRILEDSEVDPFKAELISFVKSRGRYVWQPEVYLHLRAISSDDLKAHGIKVSKICRDLGFFPPVDDRITHESAQRIRNFVASYMKAHNETPEVREVLKGAGVDHETLWGCIDYEAYIGELGGKLKTEIRHRFRHPEEFLDAAADIVKNAGRPMPMTEIVKAVGISYPAYLAHFKSVRSDEIHDRAEIPRNERKRQKH